MNITPELIEQLKQEIGLQQYFEPSETAIPKHILFDQFKKRTQWKTLPKLIFYIIMDQTYPEAKAPDGNLGYKAKWLNNLNKQ